MNIFLWVIGVSVFYFLYTLFNVNRLQISYQEIITELAHQLTQNPAKFFYPEFQWNPNNNISEIALVNLLVNRISSLALERKVRLSINAAIIPSDIEKLPVVKRDFEHLIKLANSIANAKH